jgi:hypothetical protein
MARRRTLNNKVAKDTYGHEIEIGDKIVFSWAGDLWKGIVEQIKIGIRASLIVRPLYHDGTVYQTTANVKNSLSTVKI